MYGQRSSATIQELQEGRIINKAGKSAKNFRTKRFLAPGAGRGHAWIKDFRAGALKPAWIKALRAGARKCPVYIQGPQRRLVAKSARRGVSMRISA